MCWKKFRVDLLFGEKKVGRHIVGYLDHLELDALGEKIGLHQIEQIGMGDGVGADFERHRLLGALRVGGDRYGGEDERQSDDERYG